MVRGESSVVQTQRFRHFDQFTLLKNWHKYICILYIVTSGYATFVSLLQFALHQNMISIHD
jgi:hypothetical protein